MKRRYRRLLALPAFLLAGSLGYAFLALPQPSETVPSLVRNNLADSGVSNPVPAVLLNFRGYDTLLEMAVLLAAVISVRVLDVPHPSSSGKPEWFLTRFSALLLPALLLAAFYLLWAGAHAPGGAFQAGSVLAAAGIIVLLSGRSVPKRFRHFPLRLLLVIGTAGFAAAAALGLLVNGQMLHYPPEEAGAWIFAVETAATVSIGVTLSALFLAVVPGEEPKP
ncbi:MAG: MnhB domain-containing protein [Campylobacterales bacterium]